MSVPPTGGRESRSSRYNSPFPPAQTNVAALSANISTDASDRQRTLDGWVEPSLAPPRPSFAEAGQARHGVVKGMEPLGTRPSAKIMKAATRPDSMDVRKSGPSSVSTPNEEAESVATPEPAFPAALSTPEPSSSNTEDLAMEFGSQPTVVGGQQSPAVFMHRETSQPLLQNTSSPRSSGTPAPGSRAASVQVEASRLSAATPIAGMVSQPSSPAALSGAQSLTPPPNNPAPYVTMVLAEPSRLLSDPRAETEDSHPSCAMHAPFLGTSFSQSTQPTVAGNSQYDAFFSTPRTPQLKTTVLTQTNTPGDQIITRASAAPQPYAGMPSGQNVFSIRQTPMQSMQPMQPAQSIQSMQSVQGIQPVISPQIPRRPFHYEMDGIVESAVNQALDEQHWPTAYALRTLWDSQRTNPRFMKLIEDIYLGRADMDQEKTFLGVIKHKKKEGKLDNVAEYYFNPDGEEVAPPLAKFSALPYHPSPYSTPIMPLSAARAMNESQGRRGSIGYSPISPYTDQHINKKQKGNDFPSSSYPEMNGNGTGAAVDVVEPVQQHEQPAESQTNGGSHDMERSLSQSSMSSLSSVDEAMVAGTLSSTASPAHKAKAGGTQHTSTAKTQPSPRLVHRNANRLAAETHPSTGNQQHPINASKKPGPKLAIFPTVKPKAHASNTPPSSIADGHSHSSSSAKNSVIANANHQRRASASASASASSSSAMPSATIATSHPVPAPSKLRTKKKEKEEKEGTPQVTARAPTAYNLNDFNSRLKRKVRQNAERNLGKVPESFERQSIPLLQEPEPLSDGGDSVAPGRPPKLRLTYKKTRQSQANHYDSDKSSPTLLPFQHEGPPGSISGSRAGTPSALHRPTRKSKIGTGLRVKTSPMKKKTGTAAGIPRASGERNSPTNGSFAQDDNDDDCSSCGGNGDLVCCDGCNRAFHFKCVDPPINDKSLPDEWFCNVCQTKDLPRKPEEGKTLFGGLFGNLERKNPVAFHLPREIREYFENVKTGTEGEYEEIAPPKAKNAKGYEEAPDNFKTRDSKGKAIFCHSCNGVASAPARAIIPCTYCGLYWHLDCLDPPMAKEPGPGRPFRCPAHVDDLLALIPSTLAPAHRYRKIKGQSTIRPAVSRGIKNNGHIEVEFEESEEEEELGFYEERLYGDVYKLPELGIKLDFVSQVKRKFGEFPVPPRPAKRQRTPPNGQWNIRTLAEQQAALNLASLQIPHPDSRIIKAMYHTLLAEAPPAVFVAITQELDQEAKVSSLDYPSLKIMKAYIDGQLQKQDSEAANTSDLVNQGEPTATMQENDKSEDLQPHDLVVFD